MLVLHQFLYVLVYTSWHFYAFSGTNLLTRCHSAVPVFCGFCILEKLYRKYSRNWTKQNQKFLFLPWRSKRPEGSRRRSARRPRPRLGMAWAPPPAIDLALPPVSCLSSRKT